MIYYNHIVMHSIMEIASLTSSQHTESQPFIIKVSDVLVFNSPWTLYKQTKPEWFKCKSSREEKNTKPQQQQQKLSLLKRKIYFHLSAGDLYRKDLIFFNSLLQKYTKRFFMAFCCTIFGSKMIINIADTSVSSVSANLQNILTTKKKK